MTGIILLFFASLALVAFFNGAETGFYRVNRLRLLMESLSGSRIAGVMLKLASRPSVFVATMLIGTNLSHYGLSLAIVMGVDHLFPEGGTSGELLATLALTPFIFVCGDLTPKNLFFGAPNRLLRRISPLVLFFAVLFAPLTFGLWILSQAWRFVTGERPDEMRASLARRELNELLVEGHEAGILRPVQRTLAQSMLAVASQPVKNFAAPAGRVVRVTTTMTRSEILRLAQRHRRTLLPIEDAANRRKLVGFVRSYDLYLRDETAPLTPLPLIEINENETFLAALAKLPVAEDSLGQVVNAAGATVGFVTGRDLRLALFRQA